MKRFLSSFVLAMFALTVLSAQDYSNAKKAFKAYEYNKENNVSKLSEAVKSIDKAMGDEELATDPGFWLTRGKIFLEAGTNELVKLKNPDAPAKAVESFKNVLANTPKGYQKKEAIVGLRNTAPIFQNNGIALFGDKDFDGAYDSFNSILSIDNMLKEMGETGPYSENETLQDIKFYTGYAAQLAGKKDEAKSLYNGLYTEGYESPELYKGLFDLTINEDETKAFEILSEGRNKISAQLKQLDTNDEEQAKQAEQLESNLTSMLFSEINYYLGKGQLDVLETKLKEAIEKEPDNVSLYSSLGKVYDDLNQKATEAGNLDVASGYFDQARSYYETAITKDENNLQAIYNLGALYFNKSANLSKIMNNTSDMKEYDRLKTEVTDLYNKALPYFHRAEKIDANDRNTLYALKEIYAIQDDFEKSNEYKKRLEALQGN